MEKVRKIILAGAIAFLVIVALLPFTLHDESAAIFGIVQAVPIGIALGFTIAFYIAPYFYERMAMGIFSPQAMSGQLRLNFPTYAPRSSPAIMGKHFPISGKYS